jgi:UDP-N-acetylglucosamine acyltransferase
MSHPEPSTRDSVWMRFALRLAARHIGCTAPNPTVGCVIVRDGAVLGGGAVFHQFVRVGKRAMIAGGSQFNKDIPPYSMAQLFNLLSGINIIGLRRAGFKAETRTEIRRAFKLVFRSEIPVKAALEKARESQWGPEAQEFFDFIASSKRGCATSNLAKGQVIPLEDIVE